VKPICNYCHVDDHTRVNCPVLLRRRKACFICESTQHLKAQCPDAPWNLFPRIARTTLEQPKNKGGVSLLNVEVQQKVFQLRYINPLLLGCRQRIPDFLYKMLIFTLQSSFDGPSHIIPLMFKHSRSYGNMKGFIQRLLAASISCTINNPSQRT
jgi:hypothetical protein